MNVSHYDLVQSFVVHFDNARQSLRAIEEDIASLEDDDIDTLFSLLESGRDSTVAGPDTR